MCLKRPSIPSSRSSMHNSKLLSFFCTFIILSVLRLRRDSNAASATANSFTFVSSSSHAILWWCINLENNDHPLFFACDFGSEMNGSKDSNTARLMGSTSLKMRIMVTISGSSLEKVYLFSMPFKFFKAFFIAFFTTFLDAMYFLISLPRPCLLRRTDWSSWMYSFGCNSASLVELHTSKSLRDPSRRSSTHFFLCYPINPCCVSGNCKNLSTESYKSWRLLSLWPFDDENDVEVACESLTQVTISLKFWND